MGKNDKAVKELVEGTGEIQTLEQASAELEPTPNGAPAYDFITPGPDDKGFLRNTRFGLRFQWLIESNWGDATYQDIDDLVSWLSGFFKGIPKEEAAEILWECSQEDFLELLGAILGNRGEAAEADIPKESGGEPADG